LAHLKIL